MQIDLNLKIKLSKFALKIAIHFICLMCVHFHRNDQQKYLDCVNIHTQKGRLNRLILIGTIPRIVRI